MKEKNIDFSFKANYAVSGGPDSECEEVIFVFHGQGQLSRYFIRKFESVQTGKSKIVAPEGLSRYYLEGFTGRVGAIWMTREKRETDINNYINYLKEVYHRELEMVSQQARIHMIGFSQGAATVTRFAMAEGIKLDSLNLWAGIFPPDLNFDEAGRKLSEIKVNVLYGSHDPYITESRIEEMHELVNKLKITPEIIKYEGDHSIDPTSLKNLFTKLRSLT